MNTSKPRVLLIGSTVNPVHIRSYFNLVNHSCAEILIIGSHPVDFCRHDTVDFSLKNPLQVLRTIRKIRRIATKFNPDIVHVHQANSIGFLVSLANRRKFKQVLTTWGDDVLIFPKKNIFYKLLTYTSLHFSDAITADAQVMAQAIARFYGDKKKVVIANFGIDWTEESTQGIQKEKIIYTNRLHDTLYNIDKIITHSADFLHQNPDWRLIIAANGPLTNELKTLAAAQLPSNQYEFVGFVDAATNRTWYQKAYFYVSIPSTDGTSISLLESMGYGCIPLVSDLPANCEWIDHQQNGWVVADATKLSEYLDQALAMELEAVQKINFERINKRATKAANRALFVEIYQKLLG